jgi:polyisoprenoid-binding protein YceI
MAVCAAAAMSFIAAFSSSARAQSQPGDIYTLNQSASTIAFTIYGSSLFRIKRDGQFKDFSGQLSYDPANPGGTAMDLTVYTASVDMHDHDDEEVLKSGEFFDVQHFPTMHFTSAATDLRPDGTFALTGDMTIRGVTKRMTIPVKLRQLPKPGDSSAAVFETTFQIDRTQFGLNGSPRWAGFKVSISKNVDIHITLATSNTGTGLTLPGTLSGPGGLPR